MVIQPGAEEARPPRDILIAVRQVAEVGSADQVDRAIAIVTDARKQLYQILASE